MSIYTRVYFSSPTASISFANILIALVQILEERGHCNKNDVTELGKLFQAVIPVQTLFPL